MVLYRNFLPPKVPNKPTYFQLHEIAKHLEVVAEAANAPKMKMQARTKTHEVERPTKHPAPQLLAVQSLEVQVPKSHSQKTDVRQPTHLLVEVEKLEVEADNDSAS